MVEMSRLFALIDTAKAIIPTKIVGLDLFSWIFNFIAGKKGPKNTYPTSIFFPIQLKVLKYMIKELKSPIEATE